MILAKKMCDLNPKLHMYVYVYGTYKRHLDFDIYHDIFDFSC